MGSVLEKIAKSINNKNTLTILIVLVGVVILWYFYNYQLDRATNTIRVPYAVERMDSGSQILNDNISYRELISSSIKNTDIITKQNLLVGKYICSENTIPKDGFFHQSQVCDKKPSSDEILGKIQDGYTLYNLSVSSKTTYADSILPGDYIDLYMSAKDDNGKIIYGPLIESIEVLAVRDTAGNDLFWNSKAGGSGVLLFAIPESYNVLLNVSGLISGYSIKITPVPRSASYTKNPGKTKIADNMLCQFIMSKYSVFGETNINVCNS